MQGAGSGSGLLVYSYFCPDGRHRAGGVQQVVGPLLACLQEVFGWTVAVSHAGACKSDCQHQVLPDSTEAEQADAIDSQDLLNAARAFREFAGNFDVVLSIDRALPTRPNKPSVLMSNTLCYQTEVSAVLGGCWSRIIAPTRHFGSRLRSLDPAANITVVPYGLPAVDLSELESLQAATWPDGPCTVRLPHRPDRRKGHVAAIEGLARALPASRDVHLEIAWLNEARYGVFRTQLERLAVSKGVTGQIHFEPWVDGDQRWEAMARSCGMLQLGDFQESFGLAILESVLSGRPAITSCQPAVCEVLGASELHIELVDPLNWYQELKRCWGRGRGWADHSQPVGAYSDVLSLELMAARYDRVLHATMLRS